jgi:hypothetical protein
MSEIVLLVSAEVLTTIGLVVIAIALMLDDRAKRRAQRG